jgi:hypothetical protein
VKWLALVLVVLAAGCGGESSVGSDPDLSEPEAMMLRLSDLPAGFRYGDDRDCGEVGTTEGNVPDLDQFLIATRPRACFGDFSREWGGEPATVQTVLFVFDSEDDARRAWEARKELFANFGRIPITTEFGHHDAVTFDSEGVLRPGAGEAWRDERLVVAVYEEGLPGDPGRDFANALAEKQESRIESPSDPSEEDDREVGLEDPAVTIPVYWLGREFDPGALPKLTLYRGDHVGPGSGPGSDVKIDYDTDGGGVTLDLWRPEEWARFKTTRLGRLGQCRPPAAVEIEGGRAEICEAAPGHWLARAYFDEVVVAVNMPYCFSCVGRPASDPYNSRAGMAAVVGGLSRR